LEADDLAAVSLKDFTTPSAATFAAPDAEGLGPTSRHDAAAWEGLEAGDRVAVSLKHFTTPSATLSAAPDADLSVFTSDYHLPLRSDVERMNRASILDPPNLTVVCLWNNVIKVFGIVVLVLANLLKLVC
jgi:hypothetical protein